MTTERNEDDTLNNETATPPDTSEEPLGAGDPTEASDTDTEPTLEELAAELEAEKAKVMEHWDRLTRAQAEIENLRRRHSRDLENAHKYALDGFVKDLLQVRDSMELGLNAADSAGDEALDKLREGMELTIKLFDDVMGRFNVERIDPDGEPFNPDLHQAMSMQPRDDVPANTVVAVVQKGYTLNGRLVRPALVMVSQAG